MTASQFEIFGMQSSSFIISRISRTPRLELTRRIGVAAIPNSAFYAQNPVTTTARFCFSKKLSVLDGALERLARLGDMKLA